VVDWRDARRQSLSVWTITASSSETIQKGPETGIARAEASAGITAKPATDIAGGMVSPQASGTEQFLHRSYSELGRVFGKERNSAMDFITLALMIGFFLLSGWLIVGLDRL
jgi:hypothetical protein